MLPQVNLFQMLCLAAVRFALIVDMLPFVNCNMEFFHRSVHDILAKTANGINRCVHNLTATTEESAPPSPRETEQSDLLNEMKRRKHNNATNTVQKQEV